MHRRTVLTAVAATIGLMGCAGSWKVDYDQELSEGDTRTWCAIDIQVDVPESLSVSENNSLAPNADIVWHGEVIGDRRAQVASILKEGIRGGFSNPHGKTNVVVAVRLNHFHAVTPAAVSRAPAAVHNISYDIQVFDAETKEPLTEPETIQADLEAYVGASAVTAALQGQTQRVRIVRHLAAVTAGWLGFGPDQRREFAGIGR